MEHVESSDDLLVSLVKAGDQQAFILLHKRYYGPVCEYLTCCLVHEVERDDLVKDLAQETFLRAWLNIKSLQKGFKAWLFRIARNLAIDHIRQRRRRGNQPLDEDCDRSVPGPEEVVGQKERIQAAFESLPSPYRECLFLYVKGFTLLEIADGLEIAGIAQLKEHTVRTYISEARRRLRAAQCSEEPPLPSERRERL